jgi:hypothetical protein
MPPTRRQAEMPQGRGLPAPAPGERVRQGAPDRTPRPAGQQPPELGPRSRRQSHQHVFQQVACVSDVVEGAAGAGAECARRMQSASAGRAEEHPVPPEGPLGGTRIDVAVVAQALDTVDGQARGRGQAVDPGGRGGVHTRGNRGSARRARGGLRGIVLSVGSHARGPAGDGVAGQAGGHDRHRAVVGGPLDTRCSQSPTVRIRSRCITRTFPSGTGRP